MDNKPKAIGITLIGMLGLALLTALTGITLGVISLETWRSNLLSTPMIAQPMPVLPAIDVDNVAAARPPAPAPGRTPDHTARHAGACVLGGLAGTGVAMLAGPTEIATLIAGAVLLPVSVPLVGAVLGGGFITGCTISAMVAPMVR